MFAAINFGDLQHLAERSVKKLLLSNEATARFGEGLFDETPAEAWCAEVLKGVECGMNDLSLPDEICRELFSKQTEYVPHTLNDCLHELRFWNDLYWLRDSVDSGPFGSELSEQVSARQGYIFWSLSQIRPRSKDESISVLRYLSDNEGMNRNETNDILLNLIGSV